MVLPLLLSPGVGRSLVDREAGLSRVGRSPLWGWPARWSGQSFRRREPAVVRSSGAGGLGCLQPGSYRRRPCFLRTGQKGSSAREVFCFGGLPKGELATKLPGTRTTPTPPRADLCPGASVEVAVRNEKPFYRAWSLAGSKRCQERCFGGALRRFPRTCVPGTSFFSKTLFK